MSSEKPKTGMKHPHSESHVPKEKPKKRHVLRNAALGVAAAVGLGGLAAGCAPSARAQDTTPRPRIEMVQSQDARVAPATAPSPPRPETRVAQATTASASTRGYDQTATGSAGAPPQATPVPSAEVTTDLVPMIDTAVSYERDLSSNRPQNWDVEASRGPLGSDLYTTVTVYAHTPEGRTKVSLSFAVVPDAFRIFEIPTPETDLAAPGILAIVNPMGVSIYYKDKVTGEFSLIAFNYATTFSRETPIVALELLLSDNAVNFFVMSPSAVQMDRQNRISRILPGSFIDGTSVMLNQRGSVQGLASFGELYLVTE